MNQKVSDFPSNMEKCSLECVWKAMRVTQPFHAVPCMQAAALGCFKPARYSFHPWKLLSAVDGFHFTAQAGARRTSQSPCSLVTRPVTSRPFIHGREIKPHEFLMALMRNEQQRTKCLSIMHLQCRGSHFSSRWLRLPDLTLRFVGNVKHFGLKHAWAQRKADVLLRWTPAAPVRQEDIRMIGMTRAALIWIKSTHPATQLLASTSGVFEKNVEIGLRQQRMI